MAACLVGVAALGSATAVAQQRVEATKAAARSGTVKISNAVGAVRVVGWEHDSVGLRATPGDGVERVEFSVVERETRIRVVVPQRARDVRGTELEVRVPSRSHIAVRTASAAVTVEDVRGAVDVESVSGDIRVTGDARTIYAQSAAGNVDIEAYTKVLRAKSVDGTVTVRRAAGYLDVSTVSGAAVVRGRNLWEGQVTSVSGDIQFEGSFDTPGAFYFETHSGTVTLVLPASILADFDIVTFGGVVENAFAPPTARTFSTGADGTQVKIKSFKGPIRIRRQ